MTALFAPQPPSVFRPAPEPVVPIDAGDAVRAPVVRRESERVYRRRRMTVLTLVVGLVLGIVSFSRQADATPTPEGEAAAAVEVIVEPGDTLWSIAHELQPRGDVRDLVGELARIVDPAALQPGQRIVVPARLID